MNSHSGNNNRHEEEPSSSSSPPDESQSRRGGQEELPSDDAPAPIPLVAAEEEEAEGSHRRHHHHHHHHGKNSTKKRKKKKKDKPEIIPDDDNDLPAFAHHEDDPQKKNRQVELASADDPPPDLPHQFEDIEAGAGKLVKDDPPPVSNYNQTQSQPRQAADLISSTPNVVQQTTVTSSSRSFGSRLRNHGRAMSSARQQQQSDNNNNILQVEATAVQGVEATLILEEPSRPTPPIYDAVAVEQPWWKKYQMFIILGLVLIIGILIGVIFAGTNITGGNGGGETPSNIVDDTNNGEGNEGENTGDETSKSPTVSPTKNELLYNCPLGESGPVPTQGCLGFVQCNFGEAVGGVVMCPSDTLFDTETAICQSKDEVQCSADLDELGSGSSNPPTNKPAEIVVTLPPTSTEVSITTKPTKQPTKGSSAPLSSTAMISGIVFKDDDNNGYLNDNEKPLRGFQVALFDCDGKIYLITTTDADGMYGFDSVTPGSYVVKFSESDGYKLSDIWVGTKDEEGKLIAEDANNNANPDTGSTECREYVAGSTEYSLDAGMAPDSWNIGLVETDKPTASPTIYKSSAPVSSTAIISGIVFKDDDNNGYLNDDEKPLPGALAALFDCDGFIYKTSTTDANGMYGFDSVTPGSYVVKFSESSVYKLSDIWVGTKDEEGKLIAEDANNHANPDTGSTECREYVAGDAEYSLDAGMVHQIPQSVKVGDEVCITNYIMDQYCINLGYFLDNAEIMTLENPEKHTFHCLLDVVLCRDSGYTVLTDKNEAGLHCIGYRLAETDAVYQAGIAAGQNGYCTDCTGDETAPQSGYRATVKGTVRELGDGTKGPLGAPLLENIEVLDASVECDIPTVVNPVCMDVDT